MFVLIGERFGAYRKHRGIAGRLAGLIGMRSSTYSKPSSSLPESIRHHIIARELVRELLKQSRKPTPSPNRPRHPARESSRDQPHPLPAEPRRPPESATAYALHRQL
jgi:hypothetical protein